MAGECEQDSNFWCPLKIPECAKGKLTKPCLLLYPATHASIALARLDMTYKVEKGTMKIEGRGADPKQILW